LAEFSGQFYGKNKAAEEKSRPPGPLGDFHSFEGICAVVKNIFVLVAKV
jgi:hypothetical protein